MKNLELIIEKRELNETSLPSVNGYYMIFFKEGCGFVSSEKSSILLPEYSLTLVDGHISQKVCCTSNAIYCIILQVSPSIIENYTSCLPIEDTPYKLPLTSTVQHDIGQLQTIYASSASISNDLLITKYLTDILTEICLYALSDAQAEQKIPSYIKEMKEMFDTQYDKDHSLDQLETTFSISKYRLCREFSKYCKLSPVKYLNQVRMEAAKELLLSTNLLIHEVGSCVGIENTNHFINLFKKNTGVTPLVYKQNK